ncbi:hypothetical protein [Jiella sonneratiae]|uniref:Transcriptional regulator n=1 Tax=Jiella sonneratiae TaxID=2816856 RepID=A0ABS3J0A3_9HYPH|nr:hypothetical protein [Jiella sonneratiae]MBO0902393.1 hypothetical protein [Jiella sonneratiae]
MADLSGVLRKTIDGLPRATPQMREKVYEKARAAIQRQIGAANPPLAENVVAARLAALEDAISRTEEHYSAQESAEAGAAPAAAQPTPPAANPAAPQQTAPQAKPQPQGAQPGAAKPQPGPGQAQGGGQPQGPRPGQGAGQGNGQGQPGPAAPKPQGQPAAPKPQGQPAAKPQPQGGQAAAAKPQAGPGQPQGGGQPQGPRPGQGAGQGNGQAQPGPAPAKPQGQPAEKPQPQPGGNGAPQAQPRPAQPAATSPETPRDLPAMGGNVPQPGGQAPSPQQPKPAAAGQPKPQQAGNGGGAAQPRPQQQPGAARPSLPPATMPGAAAGQPAPAGPQPGEADARGGQPYFPVDTEEPDAGDQPPAIGAPFLVPEARQGPAAPSPRPDTPEDEAAYGSEDGRIPHDIRLDDGEIPEADISAPRYAPRRQERRSGRGGKIAAAAAVILLLGAAGTAGWIYRDDIEALLVAPGDIGTIAQNSGSGTDNSAKENDSSASQTPTQTASAEPESTSTRRFTQRLLPDGDEVDEGPAKKAPNAFDEGTNVAAATNVDQSEPPADATPTISSEIGQNPSVVGGEPAENAAPGDNSPEAGAPADGAETPADSPEAGATPAPAGTDETAQASGDVAVGQKAVFYQERTEDLPGTQETGTVVWSLVDESGANGKPAEPAVRAVVDVPEEKLKLTMTIKRNSDPTLPASHVIELEFDVPQDFSGGSVANVQRLALKETEQARGEPLIGVAGKISDNYFIIALNNLDQAVQNNLALLQNQKWIDIPIAYQTGRRALISVEKGIPGDRVFKEAMKAWQAKT